MDELKNEREIEIKDKGTDELKREWKTGQMNKQAKVELQLTETNGY